MGGAICCNENSTMPHDDTVTWLEQVAINKSPLPAGQPVLGGARVQHGERPAALPAFARQLEPGRIYCQVFFMSKRQYSLPHYL